MALQLQSDIERNSGPLAAMSPDAQGAVKMAGMTPPASRSDYDRAGEDSARNASASSR